jgi:hypothetical protein
MNAEFLERDIVLTEENGTYTAADRRKGMDAYAFMHVVVKTADGKEAYPVASAVAGEGTIEVVAGPYTLTYTAATGKITVAKE